MPLIPLFITNPTSAIPIIPSTQRHVLTSRDNDQASGVSPSIWAPILAIGIFIVVVVSILWSRRRGVLRRANTQGATAAAANTREVTAEQLAGQTTTDTNATPARTTRRPRRARRASQVSVTSLPEYMKEPGDQELVVIRGRDMLDDDAVGVIMPDGTIARHARNDSDYSELPDTPTDTPLMQNNEHEPYEIPSRILNNTRDGTPSRVSFNTTLSSTETTSLEHADTDDQPIPDPRGEAPAYFEVIDLADSPPPRQGAAAQAPLSENNTTSPPSSPTPARVTTEASAPTGRRSGFRSIFSSRASTTAPPPQSHNRVNSGPPESVHSREASGSRVSFHRPTHSGGSMLSLTPFRTISRQKSSNSLHLNSPSMISLNSISSPLTHTLTRTEFTYPKSGPTPEQVKLISSREAFGKFGLPYGEDAIAFAASTSRQELCPPPGFEEIEGSSSSSQRPMSPNGAGPSRLRSESTPARLNESQETPSPDTSDQSHEDAIDSIPQTESPVEVRSPNTDTVTSPPNESSTKPSEPPSTTEDVPMPQPESSSRPTLAATTSIPPTSFRLPVGPSRPESRASMTSYATAAESMNDDDGGSVFEQQPREASEEGPSTPRMGPQHALEPTDTTITPLSLVSAQG